VFSGEVDDLVSEFAALLDGFTVSQLQDVLRKRDLPISGSKADLVDRLVLSATVGPVDEHPYAESDDVDVDG
jgi:hypothetical protein